MTPSVLQDSSGLHVASGSNLDGLLATACSEIEVVQGVACLRCSLSDTVKGPSAGIILSKDWRTSVGPYRWTDYRYKACNGTCCSGPYDLNEGDKDADNVELVVYTLSGCRKSYPLNRSPSILQCLGRKMMQDEKTFPSCSCLPHELHISVPDTGFTCSISVIVL